MDFRERFKSKITSVHRNGSLRPLPFIAQAPLKLESESVFIENTQGRESLVKKTESVMQELEDFMSERSIIRKESDMQQVEALLVSAMDLFDKTDSKTSLDANVVNEKSNSAKLNTIERELPSSTVTKRKDFQIEQKQSQETEKDTFIKLSATSTPDVFQQIPSWQPQNQSPKVSKIKKSAKRQSKIPVAPPSPSEYLKLGSKGRYSKAQPKVHTEKSNIPLKKTAESPLKLKQIQRSDREAAGALSIELPSILGDGAYRASSSDYQSGLVEDKRRQAAASVFDVGSSQIVYTPYSFQEPNDYDTMSLPAFNSASQGYHQIPGFLPHIYRPGMLPSIQMGPTAVSQQGFLPTRQLNTMPLPKKQALPQSARPSAVEHQGTDYLSNMRKVMKQREYAARIRNLNLLQVKNSEKMNPFGDIAQPKKKLISLKAVTTFEKNKEQAKLKRQKMLEYAQDIPKPQQKQTLKMDEELPVESTKPVTVLQHLQEKYELKSLLVEQIKKELRF